MKTKTFIVLFWDGSGDGGGGRGALLKSHTLQMGIVQVQRGICLFLVVLNPCQDCLGFFCSEN